MSQTPKNRLVGIAGSFSRPSRTLSLVRTVGERAENLYDFDSVYYDLHDLGPSLGAAQWRSQLDAQAERVLADIVAADLLVVGSPTYKGSYPGLFKHLIDLIDPAELRGKPVVLTATGGGDRHALIVEHQLRPLFGFFAAHALPTAVYASDRDFTDYAVSSPALSARIDDVVSEIGILFPALSQARVAAE
ncbi:FMN reductase [Rhizobium sp. YJ-22]|uniref:FMN reductase n=1 Tax=Rhizobium sp. YJ-22 TaxID=3037556 RepID=UPI001ACF1E6F|nr:FMN reductase [Rhizobium sp. YJ-22]MBN9029603.1 FMN reductase [Hyphomicrobiales bacterium]MDG3576376.1 FMN reductase [Rhizobium sp. YJ-22]